MVVAVLNGETVGRFIFEDGETPHSANKHDLKES